MTTQAALQLGHSAGGSGPSSSSPSWSLVTVTVASVFLMVASFSPSQHPELTQHLLNECIRKTTLISNVYATLFRY